MRVVFDTNIFISALIIQGSQAEAAVLKILEGSDTLIISREIINEILSVLSAKFSREKEELARVAVNLADLSEMVYPTEKINILRDVPDNRILECALSGDADIIVTGDKEMLKLQEYKGIRIITLKEYLTVNGE
ncbi:MAG: putative toxin-antitoxin system toxin component, PIN family [Nitrospirae bacterium]|nr:putative toxin-antitoxin system toxin component, PIN family [Nitrospirota bacterium]